MARILVCEPHSDIRSLLAFVVRRLGHEPVVAVGSHEQVRDVDALLVEPGDAAALDVALWARRNVPRTPIVCASIFPAGPETAELHPEAYLVKPFPLFELEHALRQALERSKTLRAVV